MCLWGHVLIKKMSVVAKKLLKVNKLQKADYNIVEIEILLGGGESCRNGWY